jgi:hypothetical protein
MSIWISSSRKETGGLGKDVNYEYSHATRAEGSVNQDAYAIIERDDRLIAWSQMSRVRPQRSPTWHDCRRVHCGTTRPLSSSSGRQDHGKRRFAENRRRWMQIVEPPICIHLRQTAVRRYGLCAWIFAARSEIVSMPSSEACFFLMVNVYVLLNPNDFIQTSPYSLSNASFTTL